MLLRDALDVGVAVAQPLPVEFAHLIPENQYMTNQTRGEQTLPL